MTVYTGIAPMQIETSEGEAELLKASMAGNSEAFGRIVERYQSLICAITYSATGDFHRSRELAQETFLRAWRSIRQLRDLKSFRSWLCRIARNVANRSIRKERFDVINEPEPLDSAAPVAAKEPDPGEAAISREQQAVVWAALEGIPEAYREPLILFYRRQQSIAQVADDLGLSEGAAKQRLSRGRSLLRAEVASLVEDVLGRTAPKKAFAVAVVAALPALAPQTAAAGVAAVAAKGSPAAKGAFATGLLGAVFGPLLGILGGLFGSWMSIKSTRSRRERRFMVRMTLLMWGEIVVLLVVLGGLGVLAFKGFVPKSAFWATFAVLMTAHFVMLAPAAIWTNRRQRQIQREEGTFVKPDYRPVEPSKGNIYGSFGGSIFGAVAWVIPVWLITGDWLSALVVAIVAITIFGISVRVCIADPKRYWRVVMLDVIGLLLLNLVVINLGWNRWTPHFAESTFAARTALIPLWMVNVALVAVFGGLLIIFSRIGRRNKRPAKENAGE